jgi:hypothetical protein
MRLSTLILRQTQDEVLIVASHFKNLIQCLSKDEPAEVNTDA